MPRTIINIDELKKFEKRENNMKQKIAESTDEKCTELTELTHVTSNAKDIIKSSKYRWVILFIFVVNASLAGMIYFNYIMFPNVLKDYFGISDMFITWTTLINMLVFAIMIIPAMNFLQGKSLRFIMLCATNCLVIGSGLKCVIVPSRI